MTRGEFDWQHASLKPYETTSFINDALGVSMFGRVKIRDSSCRKGGLDSYWL